MGSPSSSFGTIAGLSGDSHIIWPFGGSCGLTPRRRCQPGSDATRAEPVFPTRREGPARRRSRHAMVAEALAPPDAARVAYSYRDSRRNSVHKCPKTAPRGHFHRFVYTPVSPPSARTILEAQQCTQMPRNGAERPDPPICVHYCDPKATHNPSPRRNSVHKCPKMTPRGHFHRSVYTPASSPWR